MSKENYSTILPNSKVNREQRDCFIAKVKILNNRILNNKFKISLLSSILSSLMIIILISIKSDIAIHSKPSSEFNSSNKYK